MHSILECIIENQFNNLLKELNMDISLRLALKEKNKGLVPAISKALCDMGYKVDKTSARGITFTGKKEVCLKMLGEGILDNKKELKVPEKILEIAKGNGVDIYVSTPPCLFD